VAKLFGALPPTLDVSKAWVSSRNQLSKPRRCIVFTRQFLFVGSLLTSVVAGFVSAQPIPKEKEKERPVIKCELKVTGKVNGVDWVDGGEALITNVSSGTIDVGGPVGAVGNLDLKVMGPDGKTVMTNPLSSLISPRSPSIVHESEELKPGKAYRSNLRLLGMVPEEDLVKGKYKVKATFKYDGKTVESNEVEVNWPGKKE
jgi:hypothetical protein